jgi:hypothetical protein
MMWLRTKSFPSEQPATNILPTTYTGFCLIRPAAKQGAAIVAQLNKVTAR